MTTKRCIGKCGQIKPLSAFEMRKDGKDGHRNECRYCRKERKRLYHQANKEKQNQKSHIYYQNNRVDVIKKNTSYKNEHPEQNKVYSQEYYRRNKVNVLKRTSEYKVLFPEKSKAHQILNDAISLNKLTKDICCEICDSTTRKLNGHHYDYSKPLDVIWLCRKCHLALHSLLNEWNYV